VTIAPGLDYLGRCTWSFSYAVPGPNIKGARIALAGAAATMIFTDSDRFWNDKTHDVAKAATYLEGTGISWRELLPRVRAELERD
jgi:hypothetical protein